jgi:hypothetical protein
VPCTERGAPIATWRSRRIAAQVSTGADPFRAGSNTHRERGGDEGPGNADG